MDYIMVLIFGLLLGSFFNVCIFRIPKGESIAFPPSHCTSCQHRLSPLDLIPILSYVFLRGKCRYCGEKISIRYPLVEAFAAIIWVLIYITYGYSLFTAKYIFLASLIIVMSLIDYDTQEVYFSNTLVGIIGAVIFIVIELFMYKNLGMSWGVLLKSYVLGGIVPAAVIALVAFITKGMGWGDVEVIFICGLFLGIRKSLFLMLLSFVVGGIVGVILLIWKIRRKKDPVAFVPFIGVSTIAMILWGESLIGWYLRMVGL